MKNIALVTVLICLFLSAVSCFGAEISETQDTGERFADIRQICISQCMLELQNKTASCINSAEFIEDVTVPDEMVFDPGESFTKVWRLKNTGTCTWNRSYRVVSSGLFHMGGSQYAYLTGNVEPGETVDISMDLTAPVVYGDFKSEYLLVDGNGNRFGITGTRTKKEMPFWLKIKVSDSSACSIVRVSPYSVWRFSDFDAVFRIKNNSESSWDKDEIDVIVVNGADYLKYQGKNRIDLPESVAPGEAGTVIFDMIAPDFTGNSEITIQLMKEDDVICSVTNKITFE